MLGERRERREHGRVVLVGHRSEDECDPRGRQASLGEHPSHGCSTVGVVRGIEKHLAGRRAKRFEPPVPLDAAQAAGDGPIGELRLSPEKDGDLRIVALVCSRERRRMALDERFE